MTLDPPMQATDMDHGTTHGTALVSLVGAGPGDIGLLTVRGRDRLRDAEIVVYDRLIDPRLLDEAPPTAERVYVGKEAHHHLLRQDAINALLVEHGRLGKRVVRLKGGDPFLFGRGGEEAAALAAAGVPFEIVPGVTSALAVPAYAGIPVTHRDVASSVTIVSGHHDPARGDAGRDWGALAAAETLVFLMGVADLPRIAAQLVAHGRPVDTPAAAIAWGTWAAQRTVVGTLGTLPGLVAEAGLTAPATVVVGAVVGLRERLRWFDDPARKPLSGRRVLVARSRAQQSKLSAMLAALGASAVELPRFRFAEPDDERPFGTALARLTTYHYLVFTSGHGVGRFLDRLRASWPSAGARRRPSSGAASSPTSCRTVSGSRRSSRAWRGQGSPGNGSSSSRRSGQAQPWCGDWSGWGRRSTGSRPTARSNCRPSPRRSPP